MPAQRLEQHGWRPGRDDDLARADLSAGGLNVGDLAIERDARDRRAFENPGAAFLRRVCKTEAGAVRIEGRSVASTEGDAGPQAHFGADDASAECGRLESGVEANFLLALQSRVLFRRQRNREGRARLEVTLDVEPPQEGGEIERGTPPCLKSAASDAQAKQ